ncbi:MAG: response regulator [Methylotenera sp.]|nr:response regulator [Methylotenera sp.]
MMKLLLVEDSELIRYRLVDWLRSLSAAIQIDTAITIDQTLEQVRSRQPDLLILDLSLPDGNAIHKIEEFKALAPHMGIAIFTNDASNFTRVKCLFAGADWFFDKSSEVNELIALVQQQLSARIGNPAN